MEVEIKSAQSDDYEQIHALIKEFSGFIKTPEKVKTSPAQMLEDQACFQCFVAVHQDKVIGFATYFYAYYSWSGKALYLDDLYVQETYRGAGVGSRLFDQVLASAREKNCRKMRWQVSSWNHKAIEFYKKRGAAVDEVEINCDLNL